MTILWFWKTRSFISNQEDRMLWKESWRARIFKLRQEVTTLSTSRKVHSQIKGRSLSLKCSYTVTLGTLTTSSISREFTDIRTHRKRSWSTTSTSAVSSLHSLTMGTYSRDLVTATSNSMSTAPIWTRSSSKANQSTKEAHFTPSLISVIMLSTGRSSKCRMTLVSIRRFSSLTKPFL